MTEESAAELDYVQVDRALVERAIKALNRAKRAGLKVVTAESCTGGLVAMVLSEAPGAAEFLDGGFVTYTPEQKCAALNLDPLLIERHGAVSAEVADAMARGALACSAADIAVSITGVAGPEPDERGNPVGLVYFACARKSGKCVGVKREFGDIGRSRVRYAAAAEALALIARVAGEQGGIVPNFPTSDEEDIPWGCSVETSRRWTTCSCTPCRTFITPRTKPWTPIFKRCRGRP